MKNNNFYKNELMDKMLKIKDSMESFNPCIKAMPTEEDCKRIKAHEAYYRKRLDKVMGKQMLVLFKIVCGKKK